jgi:hypothetical protein
VAITLTLFCNGADRAPAAPFAPNQSLFKEDRGFIDWLDAFIRHSSIE